MLPKKRKLVTRDFKQMRGVRSVSSAHFSAQSKRIGFAPSRFAVVTAKFVDASAVARNRIRRQIFEAIRFVLPACRDGYLVVIRVKRGAKKQKMEEMRREIYNLLGQSGIILNVALADLKNNGK